MPPAVFIARMIGPVFVVIGISILLNEPIYQAIVLEATHSPTLIYLSGLVALPLGIAMLNVHRAWTSDWRVVVTVLGWLFVVAGIIRILLPQAVERLSMAVSQTSLLLPIVAVIVLILGGLLSYEGYFRQHSGGKP